MARTSAVARGSAKHWFDRAGDRRQAGRADAARWRRADPGPCRHGGAAGRPHRRARVPSARRRCARAADHADPARGFRTGARTNAGPGFAGRIRGDVHRWRLARASGCRRHRACAGATRQCDVDAASARTGAVEVGRRAQRARTVAEAGNLELRRRSASARDCRERRRAGRSAPVRGAGRLANVSCVRARRRCEDRHRTALARTRAGCGQPPDLATRGVAGFLRRRLVRARRGARHDGQRLALGCRCAVHARTGQCRECAIRQRGLAGHARRDGECERRGMAHAECGSVRQPAHWRGGVHAGRGLDASLRRREHTPAFTVRIQAARCARCRQRGGKLDRRLDPARRIRLRHSRAAGVAPAWLGWRRSGVGISHPRLPGIRCAAVEPDRGDRAGPDRAGLACGQACECGAAAARARAADPRADRIALRRHASARCAVSATGNGKLRGKACTRSHC